MQEDMFLFRTGVLGANQARVRQTPGEMKSLLFRYIVSALPISLIFSIPSILK
jgi:hypothetical protein